MSQIHSSFNRWQSAKITNCAKPRNKSGGAKRRNWAHRKSFKSVCFVRTNNDNASQA